MQPSPELIEQVCQLWRISDEPKFIRKLANWVYKSEADKLFIRITEPHHRDFKQLEAELHFIDFLFKRNIHVVEPVYSADKQLLHKLDDHSEPFYVSVFKEAAGKNVREEPEYIPHLFEQWGKTFGQLHHAAKEYNPPSHIQRRAQWDEDQYHQNIRRLVTPDEPVMYETLQRLEELFTALPKEKDHYGLIHADFHHGNFHYDVGKRITLYDFDDCVYHWFAYDIAITIFSLRKYADFGQKLWKERKEIFWSAYNKENELPKEQIELIPKLFTYRCLLVYAYMKDAVVNSKVPPETAKRFNETAEEYKEYLNTLL